jgi:signal transduction histidine kinase
LSLTVLDATIGVTAIALGGAALLARWGRTNLAAAITLVSISVAIVLVQLLWILTRGIDPYGLLLFTALDIAIVLVGVLGTERTTIVSTAAFSLITACLWIFAPRAPGMGQMIDRELILAAPMSILAQWGIAVLQIATLRTSRETLSQLGSLTMAYERVRQLDELKDEFISSVNHELRTPLMAMLGYLEVLKLSVNRASTEQLVNLVEQANQAGADLRHLVDSILETRRQDQTTSNFELQVVNVRAALEVAVRMLDSADTQTAPSGRKAPPQPRDLHIAAAPMLAIWGDQTRLQQILVNLLSNAMKYSPPGTPIVVSAYPAPDQVASTLLPLLDSSKGERRRRVRGEARAVKIVVRDYGLGIPPEQAPLLFQRFARLPRDLASNVIGNGLGLWLCQQLTQAMHGRIWVESTGVVGEGSEFHVLLPAPPEER